MIESLLARLTKGVRERITTKPSRIHNVRRKGALISVMNECEAMERQPRHLTFGAFVQVLTRRPGDPPDAVDRHLVECSECTEMLESLRDMINATKRH